MFHGNWFKRSRNDSAPLIIYLLYDDRPTVAAVP